jgi:dTDP-4-dehydrorhamnose reductase
MNPGILVVGSGGQLGQELQHVTWPDGAQVIAKPEEALDITQAESVTAAVHDAKQQGAVLVVNAAAYTAVDKAESDAEKAFAVNRDGARNLAAACATAGLPLIHISTDYVFDGSKATAYVESDTPHPLGVYGQSKLEGEVAVQRALPQHIVLRTAWVYSAFGHNFVKTMLRLAAERPEIRVVDDQLGCPTSARDLAVAIAAIAPVLVTREAPWGLYHCTSQEVVSWYDIAVHTVACSKHAERCHIVPIATHEYPTPAKRPARSELDSSRFKDTFGISFPPWRESVKRVVTAVETA